jgi:hypothetical protein
MPEPLNPDNIIEAQVIRAQLDREAELQRAQRAEEELRVQRATQIQPPGHSIWRMEESPTRLNEVIDHPDFKYACEWLCISPDFVRDNRSHSWWRNLQNDLPRDRIRCHRNWRVDGKIVPSDVGAATDVLVIYGTFIASESDRIMAPHLIIGTTYTWEWRLDSSRHPSLVLDYTLESLG